MPQTIVQISFKLNVPGSEYEQAVAPIAQAIADAPGLQWKIWLLNEPTCEAGGVYLFADAGAAQAFLDGPLVAQVKRAPILDDLRATQSGVIESLSAITRGPLLANVQEL
jgi:hypothetical protein